MKSYLTFLKQLNIVQIESFLFLLDPNQEFLKISELPQNYQLQIENKISNCHKSPWSSFFRNPQLEIESKSPIVEKSQRFLKNLTNGNKNLLIEISPIPNCE